MYCKLVVVKAFEKNATGHGTQRPYKNLQADSVSYRKQLQQYLGSAEKVKPPQEPFYSRATKKFQVHSPHGVQKNQTTMLKKYEK